MKKELNDLLNGKNVLIDINATGELKTIAETMGKLEEAFYEENPDSDVDFALEVIDKLSCHISESKLVISSGSVKLDKLLKSEE